jgi:hypothetical protein
MCRQTGIVDPLDGSRVGILSGMYLSNASPGCTFSDPFTGISMQGADDALIRGSSNLVLTKSNFTQGKSSRS